MKFYYNLELCVLMEKDKENKQQIICVSIFMF